MTVPTAPFCEIAGRIQRRILRPPNLNPHMVLLGQTRSGKDHLIRWGILPTVPMARVVQLITKAEADVTWQGWGNPVGPGQLRGGFAEGPDGTPRYQIALPPGRTTPDDAQRLLEQISAEGEAILVIGDAGRLTDPRNRGGLGCEAIVTHMMAEGGASGLSVIACANSAAWAAPGLKDQAAAVMIGRAGGAMHAPFADIADLPRRSKAAGTGAEREALSQLAPHWWLYTDHADGQLFAAVTTPPPEGSWDESWPPAWSDFAAYAGTT